jgi:hypothetical protein
VAVFCSFTVSTHLFSTLSAAKPTQSWLIRVLLTKICWHLWTKMINKNPIKKIDGRNHHRGDKKGRPKDKQPAGTKKRRELVPLRERDKNRSVGFQAARTRSPPPPTIPTIFEPTFVVGSNFSFIMQLAHTLLNEEKLVTVCYDLQDWVAFGHI